MAAAIYIVAAATNLLCAIMLLRAFRRSKGRLLFWSGLFFFGRTVISILVFVDLIVIPAVDLYPLRLAIALISVGMLMYGLVWGER